MTIKEMHSWFDILQMKGLDIEFTSLEKDHIINRAQLKYVNEILQSKYLPSIQQAQKDKVVFSPTQSTIASEEAITPLILTDINVTANSDGAMSFGNIESKADAWMAAYVTEYPSSYPSNEEGSKILMILGVDMWESPAGDNIKPRVPLRYMKNYEWRRSETNVYRQPKNYSPIYYMRNTAIQCAPRGDGSGNDLTANAKFFVTFVKEPRKVRFRIGVADEPSIHCELPNWTHDEIMAIALDDAGVATRDSALMQLNKANKDNLSETF
tara:strand:- start:914 stop:1717 length:804 start_codon:yes stop_codon:yes gene_type:complete